MPRQLQNNQITERTVIAVALVLLLFVSPFTSVWSSLDAPWYAPYIVWAFAIFVAWLLQRFITRSLRE